MTGHSGPHATFGLPDGWTKEVNNKKANYYINPEGDKRFKSLPAVERFVNGEKALSAMDGISLDIVLRDLGLCYQHDRTFPIVLQQTNKQTKLALMLTSFYNDKNNEMGEFPSTSMIYLNHVHQ